MNNSLRDLLQDVDDDTAVLKSPSAKSVATQDSLQKGGEAARRSSTKRGGKKKKSRDKENADEKPSRERSESKPKKEKDGSKPKKEKKKKSSKSKSSSSKKKEQPVVNNLETSLTELLTDEEPDKVRESGTVSTKDSLGTKDSLKVGGTIRKSKRGGRREDATKSPYQQAKPKSLGNALGSLEGPSKDFGRGSDDNDTFCAEESSKSKTGALGGGGLKASAAAPFSMMMPQDSDSEEEEDLFQTFDTGNNPFRVSNL